MRVRLKEKLTNALSPEALSKVYSSFDVVGDIAIIKAPSNAVGCSKRLQSR